MNDRYVVDYEGIRGTLTSLDEKEAMLRLEGGRLIVVPRSALVAEDDGNYRLAFSLTRFQQDGTMVMPILAEAVNVDKREVEKKVRISKTVRTEDVVVDQPLHREDIAVEHIAINRYIDEPLPIRYEGDTTIIPLVEEVLVVEKRLLLREEIRVTRQKSTVNNPQVYALRREDVHVERDNDPTESKTGNQLTEEVKNVE